MADLIRGLDEALEAVVDHALALRGRGPGVVLGTARRVHCFLELKPVVFSPQRQIEESFAFA